MKHQFFTFVAALALTAGLLTPSSVSAQNNADPQALAALAELKHKPEMPASPEVGRWYRVTPKGAVCSDGSQWYGFYKKGKVNKVLVYLYGGGGSVNNYSDAHAKDFFTVSSQGADGIETFLDMTSDAPTNPFKDWTKIVVPYATGDFHAGAGDNNWSYEGKTGTVNHHGWSNLTKFMPLVMKQVGKTDTVMISGFSAGGFGTALVSNDLLTDYFPGVKNSTVFVDAALLVSEQWKKTVTDIWKAPKRIADRFKTADFVYDNLEALSKDHPNTKILYTCSTRDGALTEYQNYLDNGILGSSDEEGKVFEKNLKNFAEKFIKLPNAHIFIWDGHPYTSDSDPGFKKGQKTTLTQHTLMFGMNLLKFGKDQKSVGEWAMDAVNGKPIENRGLELFEGGLDITGVAQQTKKHADPELPANPETMAWYRVTPAGTVSSDDQPWWGFFQKGTENKVLIEFYGGGECIDDYTAFHDNYFPHVEGWDGAEKVFESTNATDANPFKNWTKIIIPYAGGDFHCGTGDYTYTFDGKNKTVRHHGYTNTIALLQKVMQYVGQPDALVITGFSAGGFGTALLSNDLITDYFSKVKNVTVFVDAAVQIHKNWKQVVAKQWQAPKRIVKRVKTDDLTFDALKALSKDHPNAKILFDCANHDKELAKVQNHIDTGKMEYGDTATATFEKYLTNFVKKLTKLPNSAAYIYDSTAHTVLMFGFSSMKHGNEQITCAQWVSDAINGKLRNYGLDILGIK